MYIEDGSDQDYTTYYGKKLFPKIYSWGWLHRKHPHNQGWRDQELKQRVIDKLEDLKLNTDQYGGSKHRLDCCMGIQLCHLCREDDQFGFNGSTRLDYNGTMYTAPWEVQHYIKDHDYKPPDEVIEAILNGHFYTQEEIEILIEENRDIQQEQREYEERLQKIKEEKEEERRLFVKARKKLTKDPKWIKKLMHVFD